MKRKHLIQFFVGSCVIVVTLAVCYNLFWVWLMWDDHVQPAITSWQATNQLNDTANRVAEMTDDTLLSSRGPIISVDGTIRCVYGGMYQYYSSNRSYHEVLGEYFSDFGTLSWEKIVDQLRSRSISRQAIALYPRSNPNVVIWIHQMYASTSYRTVYRLYFNFNELRCCEFCPEWRRSRNIHLHR